MPATIATMAAKGEVGSKAGNGVAVRILLDKSLVRKYFICQTQAVLTSLSYA